MDYEDDDDQSKYGIDRIVECLETHMWPNMTMKGKLWIYAASSKKYSLLVDLMKK